MHNDFNAQDIHYTSIVPPIEVNQAKKVKLFQISLDPKPLI